MITIVLKHKKEESVKRFHPWVFSGAIDKMLDEEGVDRLLNFRDNEYTNYVYDVETWQMQLDAVTEKIKSLNL